MERYTVAIGDLVVVIAKDKAGGYIVTCPFDPELVTQAETIDEAIAMAKDAKKTLTEARAKKAGGKTPGRAVAGSKA